VHIRNSFFLLIFFFLGSSCIKAQHIEAYVNGSLGIDHAYPGIGVKYFLKNKAIVGLEFGTGLLGIQSELAPAGNSGNLNGSNSWDNNISSSIVIANDPNIPAHEYPGSVTTRFTGQYYRGSYEWFFPSKHSTEQQPRGLRAGFELGYLSIVQHQDVQYRSYTTSDTYDYKGTAHCDAIAPGVRVGYDIILWKHLRLFPEVAAPFYIPLGKHAKSNGPYAKETVEARLGIGWLIR